MGMGTNVEHVGLYSYLQKIQGLIASNIHSEWVVFEVSAISGSAKSTDGGHLYLELIEKETNGSIKAKAKAAIWQGRKKAILQNFESLTGTYIQQGQKVLAKLKAGFKPDFGSLTFTIEDLDPSFTLGESELQLRQLRERLKHERIYSLNSQKQLPCIYERIAVISPANGAGLGDFKTISSRLKNHMLVEFDYFSAIFQGGESRGSLKKAFLDVFYAMQNGTHYDALIFIRGGGDTTGLNELNHYQLACLICRFPIPVIVGIGHDRDNTICDEIAALRLPTPSLVATHIRDTVIQSVLSASESSKATNELASKICIFSQNKITADRNRLEKLSGDSVSKTSKYLMQASANLERQVLSLQHRAERDANDIKSNSISTARSILDSVSINSINKVKAQVQAAMSVSNAAGHMVEASLNLLYQKGFDALSTVRTYEMSMCERLSQSASSIVRNAKSQNLMMEGKISIADPTHILSKGYTLAFDANGRRLNATLLEPKMNATLVFEDGQAEITINNVKVKDNEY